MGELQDYLDGIDGPDRDAIDAIYARARNLVPEASEGRSYGMPALRYRDSPLVAVMQAKAHLGLYPFSPAVVDAVSGELDGYSFSKGTIRFSAEHPLPVDLVERIVLMRRDEIDAAKDK
ncbi:DUF1801 domain-containing protein [Agromyces protaetiae]|uniref:DUF1801 domain-containing protein n=1 Tax=Agromyces protaetiae TaxID=2509455 RepID=A0A4P6F8T7_9MICO|nr:DUF1801 domain-containing protein [Agromyces protaetiae]QAY72174.1 DUF1801 domain-containing protein [Agromyces protaetiae]